MGRFCTYADSQRSRREIEYLQGAGLYHGLGCVRDCLGGPDMERLRSRRSQQIMALEPQGVDRAVDAVGMEARAANGSYDQDLAVQQAFNVVRSGGGIGIIGVYATSNNAPGRRRSTMLPNMFPFVLSL
ncbi:hypothetical protein N7505_001335 [Penicillium chrysogenum]|uniref:Uncharacterized protein n=1 Tax=Penicillium chrysogenum TaxID=5076 RepID=A0ABQ8WXK3_PENCH|nr:hypothetical protein N7505_001335 [Penicillium chrysogenum]